MNYDYVIVGAGSAGCALAARLSEDPRRTVMVLEAGRDFSAVEDLPAAFSTTAFDPVAHPDALWRYEGIGTARQVQPLPVIRGKVLGGSGSINGSNFIRNPPEDFDGWGSPLWSADAVLPFFRRLEADIDYDGSEHGADGPIPVGRPGRDRWAPFQAWFHDGAIAAGFPAKPDLNVAEGGGVGPLPLNNIVGVRMNSALAYLNPVRDRENLHVQADSRVLGVRFDGTRAVGVRVLVDGHERAIDADEVILCAGGIESPHLLMTSGVGPADRLQRYGIAVVADVAGVGQNLSDHGAVQLEYAPVDGAAVEVEFAQTVGLIYTATDSPYRNDMRIQPSVGFHAQSSPTGSGTDLVSRMAITCLLDRPIGTGELKLTSADPTVAPVLDYRYMQEERDLSRMREAVRTAVRVVEGSGLPDFVAGRRTPYEADLSSDAALDAWIMLNVRTAFHTCGTAKLGPDSDSTAVVDERCRVRGVEGLRVADLSIMPMVGRGSMNPTAVMIGERVAALIDDEREAADARD